MNLQVSSQEGFNQDDFPESENDILEEAHVIEPDYANTSGTKGATGFDPFAPAPKLRKDGSIPKDQKAYHRYFNNDSMEKKKKDKRSNPSLPYKPPSGGGSTSGQGNGGGQPKPQSRNTSLERTPRPEQRTQTSAPASHSPLSRRPPGTPSSSRSTSPLRTQMCVRCGQKVPDYHPLGCCKYGQLNHY